MREVQSQLRKIQLRKAPGPVSVSELISVKIITAMKRSVRKEVTVLSIYIKFEAIPITKIKNSDDFLMMTDDMFELSLWFLKAVSCFLFSRDSQIHKHSYISF